MPQHGKQSLMRSSSGARNSRVEPFSRLISLPTTSRMSMGVRAMTVFGVFWLREAYNFRKDRSMTVMTRRRSARSVIASRNCFDKSWKKGLMRHPVPKYFLKGSGRWGSQSR